MPRGLFVSHGVALLAADEDWPSTRALTEVLPQALPTGPAAIVVVSAHWQGSPVEVTTEEGPLPVVREGAPTQALAGQGPYRGSPEAGGHVLDALRRDGIPAVGTRGRGLDHGALIPLRYLDRTGRIPVVQVSLDAAYDPALHARVGRALRTLPDDVLVVASGGAVHNLGQLRRFSPPDTPPPAWAVGFDDAVAAAMHLQDDGDRLSALLALGPGGQGSGRGAGGGYGQAHPTPEHYLPLLVAAGLGGPAQLLHRSWQWSSLSMATYALGGRSR